MKIAILGGSFNPFHIGHAMMAESVIKELGYDKVIFIPTCLPPHKEIKNGGASSEDRLAMVKAFCIGEEDYSKDLDDIHFLYDSCEIDRGGVSYTIDTLLYIIEKYSGFLEGKPGLIMGEEIAAEFYKWKNPEKIAELADIIIVPRLPVINGNSESRNIPLGEYKGDFSTKFNKNNFGFPFKMISQPVVTVSSTDIRNRVKENRSFKYLVPPAVFEYIKNNNLYKQ